MSDLPRIARHAGTVLVGQLATMAFGITDTLVAGRHSDEALAALSVGSAVYISVYVGLMGVIQALLPVWSQQRGGQQLLPLGRSVRQALYLCAIAGVIGVAILLSPGVLLRMTAVPAALQPDIVNYLALLAVALPPALLFRLFTTLNQSLGHPSLVTSLQIMALAVKLPLTWWLALGGGGVQPMGAVGCAAATLVVNYGLLAVALWLLRRSPRYAPYRLWQWPERPDWQQILQFARLGVPAGLGIMVEVTSFTMVALFVSRQGVVASASHQIAANVAAVLYMVPLSISIATSAQVSFWLGAQQPQRARSAIYQGFWLIAGVSSTLAATVFIARHYLAALYSNNQVIATLAASLLVWVALYHLADAVQVLSAFVLRCFGVTVLPLLIYSVLLWGLGLGGGFLLAYHGIAGFAANPSPAAFWAAGAVALAMTAAAFLALLWRNLRNPVSFLQVTTP